MRVSVVLLLVLSLWMGLASSTQTNDKKQLGKFDFSCSLCQRFAQEVKLEKNLPKKDVVDRLNAMCDRLPGIHATPCRTLAQNWAEEYAKAEDVSSICEKTFCGKFAQPQDATNAKEGGVECSMCILVMDGVIKELKGIFDKTQAREKVAQFCRKLPFLLDTLCKYTVLADVDRVIDYIFDGKGAVQICQMLKVCGRIFAGLEEMTRPKLVDMDKAEDGPGCTMCVLIVSGVLQELKNVANKTQAREKVAQFCSKLPGPLDAICNQTVLFNLDLILEFMTNGMGAQQICQFLKLCDPDENLLTDMAVSDGAKSLVLADMDKAKDGPKCTMCVLIVSGVFQELKNVVNKSQAREKVARFCSRLPIILDAICNQTVLGNLDLILEYMSNGMGVQQVCQSLKLCDPDKTLLAADTNCEECLSAVETMRSRATSLSKEQFVADFHRECHGNTKIETFCKAVIARSPAALYDALNLNMTGTEICGFLGLCVQNPPMAFKMGICDLCQTGVGYVRPFVRALSYEEFVSVSKTICRILPGKAQVTCDQTMVRLVSGFYQYMVSELSDIEMCQEVMMCPADKAPAVKPLKNDDPLCRWCQFGIPVLREYVLRSSRQEFINSVAAYCDILPVGTAVCEISVTLYAGEFYDALRDRPEEICIWIQLCDGALPLKSAALTMPVDSAANCEVCKLTMTVLRPLVRMLDEKTFLKDAALVCNYMPQSFAPTCNMLVTTIGAQAFEVLTGDLSHAEVCAMLQLCSPNQVNEVKKVAAVVPVNNNPNCELCKATMIVLRPMVRLVDEVTFINNAALICAYLPGSYASMCQVFVTTMGSQAYRALTGNATDAQVCAMAGLCPFMQENQAEQVAAVAPVKNPNCELCKATMIVLRPIVRMIDEVTFINNAAVVCSYLPDTYASLCKVFVTTMGSQAYRALTGNATDAQVCAMAGLCPPDLSSGQLETSAKCTLCAEIKAKLDGDGDAKCDSCHFLMFFIRPLAQKSDEKTFLNSLDQVCRYMPEIIAFECTAFVKAIGPETYRALVSNASDAEVCALMGLCPRTLATDKPRTSVASRNGISCQFCKAAMIPLRPLARMLDEKTFVDNAALVCSPLPDPYATLCKTLVTTMGSEVYRALTGDATDAEVCVMARLCVTTTQVVSATARNSLTCNACSNVVMVVRPVVRFVSESTFVSGLKMVCTIAGDYQDSCGMFIDYAAPVLYAALKSDKTNAEVCEMFSLCQAEKSLCQAEINTQVDRAWAALYVATHPLKLTGVQDDDYCQVCQWLVSAAESWMVDPSMQSRLTQLLLQVCTFPVISTYEEMCTNFVTIYTPQLLEYVMTHQTPPVICRAAGLCRAV